MPPTTHPVGRTGSGTRRPSRAAGAVPDSSGDRPGRSATPPSDWVAVVGLAGVLVTFGAVALEVVSGTYANSSVPGWAEWVPLAWPRPLRVVFWLAVAGAAWSFRWSLRRLGLRPDRVATAVIVSPFVIFALGVAIGADWTTWHRGWFRLEPNRSCTDEHGLRRDRDRDGCRRRSGRR